MILFRDNVDGLIAGGCGYRRCPSRLAHLSGAISFVFGWVRDPFQSFYFARRRAGHLFLDCGDHAITSPLDGAPLSLSEMWFEHCGYEGIDFDGPVIKQDIPVLVATKGLKASAEECFLVFGDDRRDLSECRSKG
jgi:hypothetical protein